LLNFLSNQNSCNHWIARNSFYKWFLYSPFPHLVVRALLNEFSIGILLSIHLQWHNAFLSMLPKKAYRTDKICESFPIQYYDKNKTFIFILRFPYNMMKSNNWQFFFLSIWMNKTIDRAQNDRRKEKSKRFLRKVFHRNTFGKLIKIQRTLSGF
jgi:hypothetical protein